MAYLDVILLNPWLEPLAEDFKNCSATYLQNDMF